MSIDWSCGCLQECNCLEASTSLQTGHSQVFTFLVKKAPRARQPTEVFARSKLVHSVIVTSTFSKERIESYADKKRLPNIKPLKSLRKAHWMVLAHCRPEQGSQSTSKSPIKSAAHRGISEGDAYSHKPTVTQSEERSPQVYHCLFSRKKKRSKFSQSPLALCTRAANLF